MFGQDVQPIGTSRFSWWTHRIPYQKPFVIERLRPDSPAWPVYKDWQTCRALKGKECGGHAAWQRAERDLAGLLQRRLA